MKVFISWSKARSQGLATALREWLPEVIQQLEPWMSSEDIQKGQRWGAEIGARLNETDQGIICVTRENVGAPWLNFEAGALAKSVDEACVRPILLDLSSSDVIGPISQFQATIAFERDDMLKLVESLNEACDKPLAAGLLKRAFDRTWKEFADKVGAIGAVSGQAPLGPQRPVNDLLGEVLDNVRGLQRLVVRGSSASQSQRPQATIVLPDGTVLEPGVEVEHDELGHGLISGTLYERTFGGAVAMLTVSFANGQTRNVSPGDLRVKR